MSHSSCAVCYVLSVMSLCFVFPIVRKLAKLYKRKDEEESP